MMISPITCPFCDSPEIEVVSPWGGQLITRQLRCLSCNTHFEAVRSEFDSPEDESSTSS